MRILAIGSDPNRNSLLRVWGRSASQSRKGSEAKRSEANGRAYLVLVAGERARRRPGEGAAPLAQSSPQGTKSHEYGETSEGGREHGR